MLCGYLFLSDTLLFPQNIDFYNRLHESRNDVRQTKTNSQTQNLEIIVTPLVGSNPLFVLPVNLDSPYITVPIYLTTPPSHNSPFSLILSIHIFGCNSAGEFFASIFIIDRRLMDDHWHLPLSRSR